jgi:hypothetical protein
VINICGLASKKVSIHIYYEKNFSKFCAGWCPHSAICASVPACSASGLIKNTSKTSRRRGGGNVVVFAA